MDNSSLVPVSPPQPMNSSTDLKNLHHLSFFERFPVAMWMIITAVLLLFISGGVYIASVVRQNHTEKEPTVVPTLLPKVSATPTPTLSLTANWNTYKNTVLRFEIKHPSPKKAVVRNSGQSIEVTGKEDNTVIEFPGNSVNYEYDFLLEVFPYTGTLEDLPNLSASERKYTYDETVASTLIDKDGDIAGRKTLWFKKVSIESEGTRFEIYMVANNHAFVFHTSPGTTEKDMEFILSTVKLSSIIVPTQGISPSSGLSQENTTMQPAEGVMCTMDAKVCPDGSYVSRTGPNCEFAACPE